VAAKFLPIGGIEMSSMTSEMLLDATSWSEEGVDTLITEIENRIESLVASSKPQVPSQAIEHFDALSGPPIDMQVSGRNVSAKEMFYDYS
jgi:hypothetical protein